jgi:ArsR family transcriptional regulator
MKRVKKLTRRTDYFAGMLKALGSPVRLEIVRWLIMHGDQGCCVGDIQKEVGGAGSTLSHHLETLSRYGLVNSRKDGLWIYYSVNFMVFKELFNFLAQDCCSRSTSLVEIKTGI